MDGGKTVVSGPNAGIERCRVGDVVRHGRAITVECAVDPQRLRRAIRNPGPAPDDRVAVVAPAPRPVHEHVGHVHPEMGVKIRTALAGAGRSRGLTTPRDDELAAIRGELASIAVDTGDTAPHRRAVAETAAETERARERVAAARGRLEAAREHGLDVTEAASELEAAVRELSEVETDGVAARQRLDRARAAARDRRETRERRFRLEDRLANVERAARAHLVARLRESYADAIDAVPGSGRVDDPFAADPVTAALAVARVGALSAPVLLDCDRFGSGARASEFLDAPVIEI
jgi:hypothetical protein